MKVLLSVVLYCYNITMLPLFTPYGNVKLNYSPFYFHGIFILYENNYHGILFTDISLSIDHHINIAHDAIFIGWVSTKT